MASPINQFQTRPIVISPWAAAAFGAGAVFMGLIARYGLTDERMAAFSGSIVAAAAAVTAVLLTARANRANELYRHARANDEEMRAIAVELRARCYTALTMYDNLAKQMESQRNAGQTDEYWAYQMALANMIVPERIEAKMGHLPHDVTIAVVTLLTVVNAHKQQMTLFEQSKGVALHPNTLANLVEGIRSGMRSFQKALEAADKAVTFYDERLK